MINEQKKEVIKPLEQTTDEKNASKFNSKAISTILSALDIDQFKIIQECKSAKDAWDTLVNYFEEDMRKQLCWGKGNLKTNWSRNSLAAF